MSLILFLFTIPSPSASHHPTPEALISPAWLPEPKGHCKLGTWDGLAGLLGGGKGGSRRKHLSVDACGKGRRPLRLETEAPRAEAYLVGITRPPMARGATRAA
ncbi:hypothetical protein SEVIR_2G431850v4 [Setaria viridis]|uniref:Uncharacterized protein n=1 Tax=Setaria viridis TaxID=4556 RepID=A0A4V6Y8Y5_SETVI|nr:hypothetical protein SEVIR_2G431850v2 [Setaria viridis]